MEENKTLANEELSENVDQAKLSAVIKSGISDTIQGNEVTINSDFSKNITGQTNGKFEGTANGNQVLDGEHNDDDGFDFAKDTSPNPVPGSDASANDCFGSQTSYKDSNKLVEIKDEDSNEIASGDDKKIDEGEKLVIESGAETISREDLLQSSFEIKIPDSEVLHFPKEVSESMNPNIETPDLLLSDDSENLIHSKKTDNDDIIDTKEIIETSGIKFDNISSCLEKDPIEQIEKYSDDDKLHKTIDIPEIVESIYSSQEKLVESSCDKKDDESTSLEPEIHKSEFEAVEPKFELQLESTHEKIESNSSDSSPITEEDGQIITVDSSSSEYDNNDNYLVSPELTESAGQSVHEQSDYIEKKFGVTCEEKAEEQNFDVAPSHGHNSEKEVSHSYEKEITLAGDTISECSAVEEKYTSKTESLVESSFDKTGDNLDETNLLLPTTENNDSSQVSKDESAISDDEQYEISKGSNEKFPTDHLTDIGISTATDLILPEKSDDPVDLFSSEQIKTEFIEEVGEIISSVNQPLVETKPLNDQFVSDIKADEKSKENTFEQLDDLLNTEEKEQDIINSTATHFEISPDDLKSSYTPEVNQDLDLQPPNNVNTYSRAKLDDPVIQADFDFERRSSDGDLSPQPMAEHQSDEGIDEPKDFGRGDEEALRGLGGDADLTERKEAVKEEAAVIVESVLKNAQEVLSHGSIERDRISPIAAIGQENEIEREDAIEPLAISTSAVTSQAVVSEESERERLPLLNEDKQEVMIEKHQSLLQQIITESGETLDSESPVDEQPAWCGSSADEDQPVTTIGISDYALQEEDHTSKSNTEIVEERIIPSEKVPDVQAVDTPEMEKLITEQETSESETELDLPESEPRQRVKAAESIVTQAQPPIEVEASSSNEGHEEVYMIGACLVAILSIIYFIFLKS